MLPKGCRWQPTFCKCCIIAMVIVAIQIIRPIRPSISRFATIHGASDTYPEVSIQETSGAAAGGREASSARHDRWVVVTTVNLPTTTLKLLRVLPGWKVVVVGDTKTPANWSLEGVVFVDVKAQEKLGYSIAAHIPYRNYVRKMFGYLYAIQHGARYIYDIDDDNLPMHNYSSFVTEKESWHLIPITDKPTFNVYPHFGQLSLWPRGLPVEHVQRNFSHKYSLCRMQTPEIQQGLADNEPDVDAVIRLMHSNPLGAYFDESSPPLVLPQGSFSPFNCQNTMFSYSSFWALFLAASPTSRVTDIIRGYWAQRLMMDSGQFLAFLPASVLHLRNAHEIIKDAELEKDLIKMGNLVEQIKNWECSKKDLSACARELSVFMANNLFLAKEDVALLNAWLSDLSSLGYVWPTLKKKVKHPCRSAEITVYYYSEQRNPPFLIENAFSVGHQINSHITKSLVSSMRQVSQPRNSLEAEFCDVKHSVKKQKLHILAVFDEPKSITELRAHHAIYRHVFSAVIYCLSSNLSKFNPKLLQELNILRASHVVMPKPTKASCLSASLRIRYNVSGVLWGPMKTIPHYDMLKKLNVQKIWSANAGKNGIKFCSENGNVGCRSISSATIAAFQKMLDHQQLSDSERQNLKSAVANVQTSRSYAHELPLYVPRSVGRLYGLLADASDGDPEAKQPQPSDPAFHLLVELALVTGKNLPVLRMSPKAEFSLGFDAGSIASNGSAGRHVFCKHFS